MKVQTEVTDAVKAKSKAKKFKFKSFLSLLNESLCGIKKEFFVAQLVTIFLQKKLFL